jgi:DNA-binding response OmpR family regulator
MKKRILIVDDDPTLINFLEPIFIKKKMEAVTAENGKEALEKIAEQLPDLIISDIMMPEMDGYELYQKLQKNPKTNQIPFIFLSSRSDPTDQLKGLRMGASEYFTKPFDLNKLINTVSEAIESAERAKELTGRVDFSVNLAEIDIENIIQLVEMNEKTGEMIFSTYEGNKLGSIFFKKGTVIYAIKDVLEGESAFYDLVAITDGYVKFFSKEVNFPRFIDKKTMTLLFEATRLQDESRSLKGKITDYNIVPEIISMNIHPDLIESAGIDSISRVIKMIKEGKTVSEIIANGKMSEIVAEGLLADLLTYQNIKIG